MLTASTGLVPAPTLGHTEEPPLPSWCLQPPETSLLPEQAAPLPRADNTPATQHLPPRAPSPVLILTSTSSATSAPLRHRRAAGSSGAAPRDVGQSGTGPAEQRTPWGRTAHLHTRFSQILHSYHNLIVSSKCSQQPIY